MSEQDKNKKKASHKNKTGNENENDSNAEGNGNEVTPYESMVKSLTNRGKNKRQVRLIENQLLQFAFGGSDSEDDSDFEVDQSMLNSDDESADDVNVSKSESDAEEESDKSSDDDDAPQQKLGDILANMSKSREPSPIKSDTEMADNKVDLIYKKPVLVCGVCLESYENDSDEILECDNCGITVHEGCYGEIHDDIDDNKSDSDAPTEPWFCELCSSNVADPPYCELCPVTGGIFKQTDTGKWVHLVCALYTPVVGFRDISRLKMVVIEDIKSSTWGAKECQFCLDDNFSRTGVCIGCDAGMCKATFHVSCAQRNGFLSDIPDKRGEENEDSDVPDLLYAHCKLHSVKLEMKKRKTSWLAYQSHISKFKRSEIDKERIDTALSCAKKLYSEYRRTVSSKPPPDEFPRLLSSCPEACVFLAKKAEILGLLQNRGFNIKAAVVSGKIVKTEANLTAEYCNYFFKREMDIQEYKQALKHSEPILTKLQREQKQLTNETQQLHIKLDEIKTIKENLEKSHTMLHKHLCQVSGKNYKLPKFLLEKKSKVNEQKLMSTSQLLSTIVNKCTKCKSVDDQHLLALCGTCRNYYHLACVDPPLTRMPKKSDNFSWQCTECDSSDEDSEISDNTPEGSTDGKLRKKRNRNKKEPEKLTSKPIKSKLKELSKKSPILKEVLKPKQTPSENGIIIVKKRKKIISKSEEKAVELKKKKESVRSPRVIEFKPKVKPKPEKFESCCICNKDGDKTSLVKCDGCKKCYHFKLCLDPPFKSSPKTKFYGWQCEDCDETDSEDS